MRSMFHSERDLALYHYAVHCALAALIHHAASSGRGWYHLISGELLTAAEVVL